MSSINHRLLDVTDKIEWREKGGRASKQAPPTCGCGHAYVADDPARHLNTIAQHERSSKHQEWEKLGRPIPVQSCGCGESFARAPRELHNKILDSHRSSKLHLEWVSRGCKPVGPKAQSTLSFGSGTARATASTVSAASVPCPETLPSATGVLLSGPVAADSPVLS